MKKLRKTIIIFRKIFITILWLLFLNAIILLGYLLYTYLPGLIDTYNKSYNIVNSSSEETFKEMQTSYIYDSAGAIIATLKTEKNITYLEIDDIPSYVIEALIAVEDRNFFKHSGVDFKGILRSIYTYIKSCGSELHGASTITQQLSRNKFLSHDVTLQRKINELFISIEIEKKYSKNKILEFYINNIYFSNNYYGIAAAARGYFNQDVNELTLSKIAYLCAIPNSPNLYNPYTNHNNTLKRRNKILFNMYEEGYITLIDYYIAYNEIIYLIEEDSSMLNNYETTYAIDCTIRYLMKRDGFEFRYKFDSEKDFSNYNDHYEKIYNNMKIDLYTGGYHIYTSIEPEKQRILQDNIDRILSFNKSKNQGIYELQGAATCIDNETGKVIAVVGGRSQKITSTNYTFNRAYQGFRQPGSAIKPLIVYTPSIQNGYSSESIVYDIKGNGTPLNSDNKYLGKITLQTAVEQSRNVVAWNLFKEVTPKQGLSFLEAMKFSKISILDYGLPSSLGGLTYGTTVVEMAGAYSVYANEGKFREPTCIVSIIKDKEDLYVVDDEIRIFSRSAAKEMFSILKGVISSGTAKNMYWNNNVVVAGKTGTTNDYKDGWFCGVSNSYSMSVWVGFDVPKSLAGLSGSTYPAQIWKDTMIQYIEQN